MSRTRILIADDHEVVRRGLRAVLEAEGMEVCGEAATGREAVEAALRLKPEVVVLDISMPELSGFDATRQVLASLPRARVIILTMHDAEQMMHEALRAGARGYLLKADAGRELVAAVKTVIQGRPYFTSRLSEILLESFLAAPAEAGDQSPGLPELTPREREVLQLLTEGKSNRQIATTLGISAKTVETHRSAIFRKLKLNSIGELIRYAVRNKILPP